MKYTSYKGIKERITDYITRINDLKYRGYEKDINYLKNLCRNFQRTVGDEAEKVIVDHLDEFAIYLKQQEFYAVMKQDKFYKCIMNIKKRIRRQDFDKKDYDLSILDNLLNDYVIFKWNIIIVSLLMLR